MATPKGRGKNQLFRLYILDDLLKRRDMFYSRDDLLRLCNERRQEYGFSAEGDEVTRWTVETDLEFLGYAKPGHTPKDLSFYEVFLLIIGIYFNDKLFYFKINKSFNRYSFLLDEN